MWLYDKTLKFCFKEVSWLYAGSDNVKWWMHCVGTSPIQKSFWKKVFVQKLWAKFLEFFKVFGSSYKFVNRCFWYRSKCFLWNSKNKIPKTKFLELVFGTVASGLIGTNDCTDTMGYALHQITARSRSPSVI